jgi:hypothetical protein
MSTPIEDTEPDATALKDFLRSDAPKGSVQFEVSPEIAEELGQTAEASQRPAEEEPVRVRIPMDPTYAPDQPLVANMMHWTLQMPDLGVIEVSDFEKTLYLKAVDNDEPVIYEIELPMGPSKLTVRLKSRSVFEERSVFSALEAAGARGEFKDPAAVATKAQLLTAAVQVLAINNHTLTGLDLSPANWDIRKAAGIIEAHSNAVIGAMSGPRWGAVLTALRIFEIKVNLCNTNANNETFWKPAS